MKQISEAEFNQRKIGRQPSPLDVMFGLQATSERFWFEHDEYLGVVCLDLIDSDWSFVALEKHKDGKYRCFEVKCSYREAEMAIRELAKCLNRGPNKLRRKELNDLCNELIDLLV